MQKNKKKLDYKKLRLDNYLYSSEEEQEEQKNKMKKQLIQINLKNGLIRKKYT